jgi:autotransporter translocation and assembly factor TamB
MKSRFLKKILISAAILAVVWQGLQFECTQKACIKILIRALTSYKASALEIKASRKFPFSADIQSVTLIKKKVPIATLKNILWKIPSFTFNNIFLNIDECNITTEKAPLDFDFSNISPSIIGYFLQNISGSLQRFNLINIDYLQINNNKLSLQLKHQHSEWIGVISHDMEKLTLTLAQLSDHSRLHLEGFWGGQKYLANAQIYKNAIDFSTRVGIQPFVNEKVSSFFGEELSLTAHLEKTTDWQLLPLKIETSNGHTLQGECTQQKEMLSGKFVWILPKADTRKLAKCHITLEGASTRPTIKWEFQEGIELLEKAFGECTLVDANHIRLDAKLQHDEKNTASLQMDICLSPFLMNGNSIIASQDLQKLLHIFWPSATGSLNFKASFENVSSLEKGSIAINGQGTIHDTDFHLPIDVNIAVNNGLGEGELHLTKGHYQSHPLDAHITFNSTSTEVYIEKCKLQLQDLQLALLKPTTYHFENGLSLTQMQFCAGLVEISNLKLGEAGTTVGNISLRNIQLHGLKILFGDDDITGVLNGQLQKLQGQSATVKLDVSKGYWQQHQDKQTYKILNNLNAALEAQFENAVWKWKFNVKDQDKINLETKGSANLNDSTIDAHIKGTTRLKLLTDWLATDDRIFGDISINLRAKGAMNSPVLEGSVDADNGLYENSEVGTFYQNIIIRTKAQGKRLIVNRFTAQDVTKSTDPNQGQLRGEGWIDFTNPLSPVFNVPMHLLHLRIAQNDGFVSDASGTLIIAGKGADVGCKGEVTLEKASYFIESSADTKVPKIIDRDFKKTKEKQAKQYATAFPLEILVHNPDGSFKVLGSGADTTWKGDFYVRKSIVNPFLVGTVHLHEGTLDILGKVLKITHGEITFVDDDRNNPRLDIRAIKKIEGGIIVVIEIKGTGNSTIIDFTSTPSMPEEEILALLLFGKKLGEVSVLQSVQLAELARSEDKGKGFFEKMRESFGFDQFEFKTSTRGGASETDEDATPQERSEAKTNQAVRIGKEFGKVQVAIEQGAGSETSKVVVSTPLGKNLALQGDVGAAQNSGVGISWIKRY